MWSFFRKTVQGLQTETKCELIMSEIGYFLFSLTKYTRLILYQSLYLFGKARVLEGSSPDCVLETILLIDEGIT